MRNSEYTANVQLATRAAPAKRLFTGSVAYPLTQQIASTVQVHGYAFAHSYYTGKGVTDAEFALLARGAGVLQ